MPFTDEPSWVLASSPSSFCSADEIEVPELRDSAWLSTGLASDEREQADSFASSHNEPEHSSSHHTSSPSSSEVFFNETINRDDYLAKLELTDLPEALLGEIRLMQRHPNQKMVTWQYPTFDISYPPRYTNGVPRFSRWTSGVLPWESDFNSKIRSSRQPSQATYYTTQSDVNEMSQLPKQITTGTRFQPTKINDLLPGQESQCPYLSEASCFANWFSRAQTAYGHRIQQDFRQRGIREEDEFCIYPRAKGFDTIIQAWMNHEVIQDSISITIPWVCPRHPHPSSSGKKISYQAMAALCRANKQEIENYDMGWLQVSHICHQKNCVNPRHLTLEPGRENLRRAACQRNARKLRTEGKPIPTNCDIPHHNNGRDGPVYCRLDLASRDILEIIAQNKAIESI